MADLNARILKQVEYYFSPQNLPKDGYLQSKMNDSMEVSLATISDFRKVQELTRDKDIVAGALAESGVLVLKDGMIHHKHAVNDKKSFVMDVTVHNQEVTEENVKQLLGEAWECRVVLEDEKKKMNDETSYSWVVTMDDEAHAKLHREQLNTKTIMGGTIKTKLRITYDRPEDEQIRLSLISTGQAAGTPYRPKRIVEFPSALRPLLVGRGGANIKKLTEKYPGLHIDTRSDDTNIVVYADSEDIIAKAVVEINKYKTAPPPDAEKRADGPDVPKGIAGRNASGHNWDGGDQQKQLQQTNAALQQQMMLQSAAIAQAQAQAQAQFVQAQAQAHAQQAAQAAQALQQQQLQQQQQLAAMQQMAMKTARTNQGVTQDNDGHYSREFQIPSIKTGLLIGRKGCQKAKIEEQFPGIRIKVTTEDTKMGFPAVVTVTAADPRLVQQASAHILSTYGTHTVPPSQAARPGLMGTPQSGNLGIGGMNPGMGGMPGMGIGNTGVHGLGGVPGVSSVPGMGGMGGNMNPLGAGVGMNPMMGAMANPMMGMHNGMNTANPMMNMHAGGMSNAMNPGINVNAAMGGGGMGGAGMGGAAGIGGAGFGQRFY